MSKINTHFLFDFILVAVLAIIIFVKILFLKAGVQYYMHGTMLVFVLLIYLYIDYIYEYDYCYFDVFSSVSLTLIMIAIFCGADIYLFKEQWLLMSFLYIFLASLSYLVGFLYFKTKTRGARSSFIVYHSVITLSFIALFMKFESYPTSNPYKLNNIYFLLIPVLIYVVLAFSSSLIRSRFRTHKKAITRLLR